jgi:hypothetical protein
MFAALGGAFLLSAGAPAYAQHYDRHDHYAGRDYHHHHDWNRGYYAPPVVVAPPAYGYYAPPPVAYAPAPGISIGINIP